MKLALCLVVLGILPARGAWAGAPSNRDRAVSLFAAARQHMADGDFLSASAELSESQNLDPQVGTALNLAYCYERMGRTATAWSMWLEAAAAAAAKGQRERQEAAVARASALQATLLHATVVVTPRAARDLVRLAIDRTPLPQTAWGLPVPLDPGKHELVATADRRRPWSRDFVVAPGAEPSLVVPELEPVETTTPAPASHETSAWTVALWTTGATAVAAAAVGGAFGAAYQADRSAANRNCARAGCNGAGVGDLAAANTEGWIANTMFAVAGAALVAGGVTFVFFHPTRKPAPAWIPAAGPLVGGGGAAWLTRSW